MKEKLKMFFDTKEFHICMIIVIIIAILFVSGIIVLKYNVEGETNLPFKLSKISVISTIEGNDNDDAENKWNLTVNQNNDIYLYINKNDDYKDTVAIDKILINNFAIAQAPKVGEIKLYKPDAGIDATIFRDVAENETASIEYAGDLESSIKDLKVSNQGGLIVFRYANTNIGKYVSNEDAEINHNDLIKKLNVTNDDIKFKFAFDIAIKIKSGATYKSNIELELPVENVVENGTQSVENTDLSKFIFKRVNNE